MILRLQRMTNIYKSLRNLIFYYNNYYAKVFGYGIKTFCSKKQVEEFEKAMTFGAILRDFMIKSMGYSIINHDKKEVITSNNEDERLADCLEGGYSLDYKQPVNFIPVLA